MNFLFHHAVKAKSEESAFVKADIEQVNQHLKLITIEKVDNGGVFRSEYRKLLKNKKEK